MRSIKYFAIALVLNAAVIGRAMTVTVANGVAHTLTVYYQVTFEDVNRKNPRNTFATLKVIAPGGNTIQSYTLDVGSGTPIDDNQDYTLEFTVSGPDGDYQVNTNDGWSGGSGLTSSVYDLQDTTPAPPATPTVSISSNISNFDSRGGNPTLSWSSTDADTVIGTTGFSTSSVTGTTTGDATGTNLSTSDIKYVTYSITVRGPGGTASDSVTIAVAPKQQTKVGFTFSPVNFIYNGDPQAPNIVSSVFGATYIVSSGDSIATDAGSYNFTVAATGDYESDPTTCYWSIEPKPVSFSFGDLSQQYDGGTKTATVSCSDPNATFDTHLEAGPEVGHYSVTATAHGNYTGEGSATLVIEPKPVSFTFSNLSHSYDGSTKSASVAPSDPNATYDASLDGGPDAGSYTVSAEAKGNYVGSGSERLTIDPKSVSFAFSDLSYSYDGNTHTASVTPSDASATYDTDLTKGPSPGSYTVSASANGNYTGSGSDTLVINQPIATTFDLSPTSFVYDGAVHSPSVTSSPADATFTTSGTNSATNVGNYTINATANGNYGGESTLAWSITAKPVTFTLGNSSATYDGKPHTVTVTASDSASTYSLTYTGTAGTLYNTSSNAPSAAGTYTVNLAATGNYSGSASGILTIAKAPLVVRANSQTKTYGSANPALTYTITGFVNGETASVVSGAPSVTTVATGTSAVGTYNIVPAVGTLSATNYAFTFANGTLTIAKAALTITANDQTKVYGSANPSLTYTLTGFVNGETTSVVTGAATLTTSALGSSGAGSYAITPALGTLSAVNYSFGPFVNGTLTVTKASLTAKADDQTKTYGSANPSLTISYSGFVNGDNAASLTPPTASTTATPASSVGSYPITLTGGSAANYTLTLTGGTLTVAKAVLTIKADNQTKTYGTANPALTYTFNGFVGGDTAAVLTGAVSLTTAATTSSPVGDYPIVPAAGTLNATNYQFSLVAGTLTIVPKAITFSFSNLSFTYDGSTKSAAVVASDPTATYTSDLTKGPNAGTYTVSATATGNYTGSGHDTLTIGVKPITFTFGNLSQVFDGAVKTATAIPSDPAATFIGDLTKGPSAGNYSVSATATGNYSGSGSSTLVISAAAQLITLTPSTATVFIGQSTTFTAAGGKTAYAWGGDAGATGTGSTVTLTFPTVGTHTLTVSCAGSNDYQSSNTATATIDVASNHQVSSLLPLESSYTVTDAGSPMAGQTYRRIWNDGGWVAYLGRSGVRFEVKGQAWPAVQAVELQAKSPGGSWTQLASENPSGTNTSVDTIFSVMLGTTVPGQPLVPTSYQEGNPQTGQWLFRARVQDGNGAWSDFSPEVPVQVVLPVVTKTLSGQTVPPAGDLGQWFNASSVKTYSLPFWIP